MTPRSNVPEGFEALYRGSIDRVYSYARARVGPDEAEDVASEVFAAALLGLQRGNGDSITEAWLIAVTRNKVIDRWRSAQRRASKLHLLVEKDEVAEPDPNADRVTLALDELSLRYRSVLLLHYLDGHPMAEVAEQLGMSLEAARSAIARARRAFRIAYGEVVLDG